MQQSDAARSSFKDCLCEGRGIRVRATRKTGV